MQFSMQWMILPGLVMGLTVGNGLSAIAAPPSTSVMLAQTPSPTPRQNFFLGGQAGFRFAYPEGYRLDSSVPYREPTPEDPLVQSFELWKAAEYYPGRSAEAGTGTEWPAHISIRLYANPGQKPLESWMGELVTATPQVRTVAGLAALAFPSTGLYEYDNVVVATPDGDHVVHLQVGYLDGADPMRQAFQTVVGTLVFDRIVNGQVTQINYSRLQALLAVQDWQWADLETRMILARLMGSDFYYPHLSDRENSLSKVPCSDLQIIDALWTEASDGRFSLRTQKQIWDSLEGADLAAHTQQFGAQVGWRQSQPPANAVLNQEWKLDFELTDGLTAPPGHLPWIGVPSVQLDYMLMDSGAACGTCTVDAMYITRDRFQDYLGDLFARLEECPCFGP